ncbi:60S ribosomal protein L17 (nucleomorph) [Cryptomonas paramecium]|uniref:60S ribosomal protein L17 n=1 Tax=Cryptomonas paramaecium TaxID=2898 RepID=F2HHR1_9CRYP|nr:60S ribosomal protein L17 [Cryptomonas paramecium]AEA38857.1 60S ribosomal protein L17 [Cryptomonas paramecium]|mmetsp:Transcript_36629/g.96495  ORF Transcript_36629/g.96495 Transcript_36629/m.96495 type:complete len:158 (+) Transcript_36629:13496-13969(+)
MANLTSCSELCKASIFDAKVHFKNTRETANAIRGMGFNQAKKFLKKICLFENTVPFKRYKYGISRKSQNNKKHQNGRWPIKSAQFLMKLLKNIESNASRKNLDMNYLYIKKIQVNKSVRGNRRTFRAHGCINSFSSHPCHIEMWVSRRSDIVQKSFS